MISRQRNPWITAFLVVGWLGFISGITMPAFKMVLIDDPVYIAILYDASLVRDSSYSIVGSCKTLLMSDHLGDVGLGLLITSFSVLIPFVKLLILTGHFLQRWRMPVTLHAISYWGLLDVMVVAVLASSVKGLPFGSRIVPMVGIFCYATYVVSVIVCGKLLHRSTR